MQELLKNHLDWVTERCLQGIDASGGDWKSRAMHATRLGAIINDA